ncbi:MAG: ABC transporter substrate-binding protein [Bacteroidales bacterium]|nr:ABC transporter substrate-binding protein [Bacteroidales bacterium]
MKKICFLALFILFSSVFLAAQTITPPVPVQISEHIENIDGRYFILHRVEQGQTLFSISRAYEISVEQIRRTSDMLEIQIDEILLIPTNPPQRAQRQAEVQPEIVLIETIAARDVDGGRRSILHTSNEENYEEAEVYDTIRRIFDNPPRSVLNVALMLPLYLNEAAQIRITPNTSRGAIRPFSFISFYQGAMLAAQKFYHEDVEINVHVFDVTEDTNTAVRLINGRRLHNMDILIGPFFARSFSVVSNFAKQQEIFIVNPLSSRSEILDNNPFAIKINTSETNQLQALLNYAAQRSAGDRIFVLSNDSVPNDRELARQTRLFFEGIEYRFNNIFFLDISQEGFPRIQRDLATQTGNSFIFISNDDALVTAVLTRTPRRDHIPNTLYSLRHSPRFDVTDPFYLNNLQVHYIEPFFVDHDDERVMDFDRLFFQTFEGLPDERAYRGFDVMSFVLELLRIGNTNYGNYLESTLHKGLHNYIQLKRTNPLNGLENQQTNILRIKNSRLQKANI